MEPPIGVIKVDGTYKEKIASALSSQGRFLNATQIINIIHGASPHLSRDEVKSGVNSAKSILLKEKAIVKRTAGKSNLNSFYGSPKWIDESGNIIPRYMYDESLVKEKKPIEI